MSTLTFPLIAKFASEFVRFMDISFKMAIIRFAFADL
jgi:hypothetical protein